MLESIAFIPDGNRRFAKSKGISIAESYLLGTKKALQVVDWLDEYPQIKIGTFYALSLENFKRDKSELDQLFDIFNFKLAELIETNYFNNKNLKVKFIGQLNLLPNDLQALIKKVELSTKNNLGRLINIAIAYNGQQEIVDACKQIVLKYGNEIDSLSIEKFNEFLYSSFKFPDLIIRTSNEQRLSGFLTYQSAYSEFFFSKKLWPEFFQEDLSLAIDSFNFRHRRFGR